MEKIKLSVCIVQFNSAENNAVLMEEKLPQNELEAEFESLCFILVAIKKKLVFQVTLRIKRGGKIDWAVFIYLCSLWVTGRIFVVY